MASCGVQGLVSGIGERGAKRRITAASCIVLVCMISLTPLLFTSLLTLVDIPVVLIQAFGIAIEVVYIIYYKEKIGVHSTVMWLHVINRVFGLVAISFFNRGEKRRGANRCRHATNISSCAGSSLFSA